ncbi:hypothetical protein ACTD5D_40845 [Nocardia takedensis]|uniref:hypothetical protein n=1 Tax=Nocardia takedensis TaxID=259390 RepID=UPI003F758516
MTMPHDPIDGNGGPPSDLYGYGPWLGLYVDDEGKAVIELMRRQCRERRVKVVWNKIGEIPDTRKPSNYPVLVIALPASWNAEALRAIAVVLTQYRLRRPQGLEFLLEGGEDVVYEDAGIVQVVARQAADLQSEIAQPIERISDAIHYTDEKSTSEEVDFFHIYATGRTDRTVSETGAVTSESLETLRSFLADRRIRTLAQAREVRAVIEHRRDVVYNSPSKPKMRNPFGEKHPEANILELVLAPGGPFVPPKAFADQFKVNARRAVRETFRAIQDAVPGAGRLPNRDGTRDAIEALRELYRKLVAYTDSPDHPA